MDNEIWLPVIGFEDCFCVSNMGRVKSISKVWMCGHRTAQKRIYPERLKKLYTEKDGYVSVILMGKNKREKWLVHRLVAVHFIPNPENKPEVNHKKGLKFDNRASELEWSTYSENGKHAFAIGLKKVRRLGESKSAKTVLDTSTGIFYDCLKEAAIAKQHNYQKLSNKLAGSKFNNTSLIYV